MAQPAQLRFDIGSRVLCNRGRGRWPKGTVIALHYRERHWPSGRVAPYQVKLDSGALIFAPEDNSRVIRPEGKSSQPARVAQGVEDGKRTVDGRWREGREGDEIHVIRGSHIRWFGGTESHIKVGMHRTVLLAKLNGYVLRARLSSTGRELLWSDGDVCLRTASEKATSSETAQKTPKCRQLPQDRLLQEAKVLTLFRHFDTDSAGRLRHTELARLWAAVNGGAEFSDAMYCAACAKAGVTPQNGLDIEALGMMYAIGLANLDEHLELLGLVHEGSPNADYLGQCIASSVCAHAGGEGKALGEEHHLQSQFVATDVQLQCEERSMNDLQKEAEADEDQRLRKTNEQDRERRHRAADEERRRKIEEKQRKHDLEETHRRMKAEQKEEESRKKVEAKQLRKAEAKKQQDTEKQRLAELKLERSKQDVAAQNRQQAKERPASTQCVQRDFGGPKELVKKKYTGTLKAEQIQFPAGSFRQERPTKMTFATLFGEHLTTPPCVSEEERHQQQMDHVGKNLAQQLKQTPPRQQQQQPQQQSRQQQQSLPNHQCIAPAMTTDLAHPMPSDLPASVEPGVRGQVVRHAVSSYSAEASGYLSIALNDLVAIRIGEPSPGDTGCAYLSYVFGWRLADGASGWLPEAVLGCTSWERYQDDDGNPWCYNVETGSWRWEKLLVGP